ncbi:MAG: class I SAM-dependent methyltransferase [Candidatus Pacebacteria bacterium]|nr:class I SAM-dependent methyltransferase [Candidatus Paceibacterota bacterium]
MIPDPNCRYQGRHFHLCYCLEAISQVRKRVIDIGCGTGAITFAIVKKRPDLSFYGCDKDERDLAVFKKKYGRLGVRLFRGDACRLKFKDKVFNAALMIDVLEHLKKPEKALREAARVLKKRGVFYLVVPLEAELFTIDGWLRLLGINLKKKPIGHIQQFRLREVKAMLARAGFKVTRIRFSHHFFYQFFSLFYYVYVAFFKKGEYQSLASKNKKVRRGTLFLEGLLGRLIFWESSLLRRVRGQTVHITARKL